MADHFRTFPYEPIKRKDENYFDTWQEARDAGFDDNQIWSVVETEGTWTFGPPHHRINLMGYVATNERHDGETYYHEEPEPVEIICTSCGDKTDTVSSPDEERCPDCYDREESAD